ncbi:MAG: arylformamidase [Planctomycetia bacterium]|nr:arylformamidase [Planctomycetia bacterium]
MHTGNGPSIDQCDLSRYLGRCQVLRVKVARGQRVGPISQTITAEKVLIATDTYPSPEEQFAEDFAALSVEMIAALAAQGVHLIGIDTPSVDLFASKDLPAHAACLNYDIAILEGLVLSQVPEGEYELIALPLRLEGYDASPVRAILRTC